MGLLSLVGTPLQLMDESNQLNQPDHATMSLGRRAVWVTLGRLSNAVAILLVGVVLSRAMQPADYGQYQLAWVFLNLAIPLFLFGTPLSISFFLAPLKGADRDRDAVQHVALICFLTALFALGAVGLWISGGIGPFTIPEDVLAILPLGTLIGSGMIACGFLEPILIVYGKHKILAASLLLFSALHLSAALAGWFLGQSLWWIFVGLSCSVGLRVAWSYLLLFKLLGPGSVNLCRQRLAVQLKYVWPVGIRDGLGILSQFADKLIFASFFTSAQFALYFNGAWELPLVGIVVHSLLAILLPELRVACRRGDMDQVATLMHFAARRVALLLFPATALGFLLAPQLTSFLFGEAYRASGDVFRVFILLLPLRVSIAGSVLLAANRARTVLLGSCADLVLAVVLGLALIPSLGTLGPAVALVASTFCQVCYYTWKVVEAMQRPLPEIMPWRVLGRLGGLSLTAALGASWFVRFESVVLNLVVPGSIFLLLLMGLGFGLRLLEEEERSAVKAVWRLLTAKCRSIV